MVLNLLLLAALVKLLLHSNSPSLCAGFYAVGNLVVNHLTGHSFTTCLITAAVIFAVTFIYFWLLNHFEDNNLIWWPIAVVGAVLIFIPTF